MNIYIYRWTARLQRHQELLLLELAHKNYRYTGSDSYYNNDFCVIFIESKTKRTAQIEQQQRHQLQLVSSFSYAKVTDGNKIWKERKRSYNECVGNKLQ